MRHSGGFVVFLAVLVVTIAIATGLTMANITIKSLELSKAYRESIYAIYAADTGAECALLWDVRAVELKGYYVFPTSTDSTLPSAGNGITCLTVDIPAAWTHTANAKKATTTFQMNLSGPRCVIVEVAKDATDWPIVKTSILSRGYNTSCSFTSNTVERAIRVTY